MATPPGLALAIAGSALFIAAAFAALRWPIRDAGRSYLAVGLVVAAFGQLHAAIYPGFYSSLVTTSDALRLAFYAILLLGVLAGTRDDLRALRVAFAAIDRLRDGDRARAALEERSRLARELHDGLAQDLWLARLRAGEVARHVSRSGGGRRALADLTEAVDQGVIDARQAILALRAASRAGSFPDLVDASAGDFRDATGIPTEAEIGHDLPALAPRQEVELLGILHEALTNVRRHARAGRVRVALARDGDALVLEVGDDGRGFDPGALAAADRYGIRAMGERATLAGASLTVGSSPGAGTLIVVRAEPLRA